VRFFGTGHSSIASAPRIRREKRLRICRLCADEQRSYGSSRHGSVCPFLRRRAPCRVVRVEAVHIPFRGQRASDGRSAAHDRHVLRECIGILPRRGGQESGLGFVASPQPMKQLPECYHQLNIRRSLSRAGTGFLAQAKRRERSSTAVQYVSRRGKGPHQFAQLKALGIEPKWTTPEEFRVQIDREHSAV